MNRDKQIEKMAKDLCHTDTCEIKKIGIPCNHRCKAHIYATRAIDKGYRKASEVAFEMLDKFRNTIMDTFLAMCSYNDYNKINLLQIGDAVDSIYDDLIEKIKEQYNG